MATREMLIEAIEDIATQIADRPEQVELGDNTYQLIGAIYDSTDRIATALEKIVAIMEKQNGSI
jgi:hypothetical protein